MIRTLFGFHGRISRLLFLGYGLVATVIMLVPFAIGTVLLMAAEPGETGWGLFAAGLVLTAAGLVIGLWAFTALTVKRLHDMDMSGVHVVWIMAISIVAGVVVSYPWIAVPLNLVALGVTLWLLFAPGRRKASLDEPAPGN